MKFTSVPFRARDHYELVTYRDSAGEFRWTQTDRRNNEIVGASTQGYVAFIDCARNCWTVTGWLPDDFELRATWEDDARGLPGRTETPK